MIQASVAMSIISALFWDIIKRRTVSRQSIGPIFKKSFLDFWTLLKMRPIGCPETLGRNHRSTLRNTQKSADLKIWQQYNSVKSKQFKYCGGVDKQ